MDEIKETLVGAVADALKAHVPSAASTALEELSAKSDSATSKAVFMLLADYVRQNGPDGIESLAGTLSDVLSSDDSTSIHRLQNASAMHLSDLVDALQTAEAEDRSKAASQARAVGLVLGDIAEVIFSAAVQSLAAR